MSQRLRSLVLAIALIAAGCSENHTGSEPAPASSSAPSSSASPGDAAAAPAQRILTHSNIKLYTTTVRADLEATAKGEPIRHCDKDVRLDAKLLDIIAQMGDAYPLTLNYLVSGRPCDPGLSGQGRGADFGAVGLIDNKAAQTHLVSLLPDGGGLGERNCMGDIPGAERLRYYNDACNHVHIDVGRPRK